MKGKKLVIITAFFVLILFMAILLYIVFLPEKKSKSRPQPAIAVQAVPIKNRQVTQTIEAIGSAKAYESVIISANVTEYVASLHFEDGDRVKKNDILVELNSVEEQAKLAEAKARLKEAELQLERLNDLTKKKFASKAEYDTQKATVESTRAQVNQMKATLADRTILAPFDGILGFRMVSEGTLIEPGDRIVTLDMIEQLRVDFSIPEKFLGQVNSGQSFTAFSVAYPNDIFSGKITTIDSRIDDQSRSVVIRGVIDNSHLKLKPGMLLKITLPLAMRDVLSVPEEALLAQEDKRYIFIVPNKANKAYRKIVSIISRHGKLVDVEGDIKEDAQVVTRGAFKLKDGQEVIINHVAK